MDMSNLAAVVLDGRMYPVKDLKVLIEKTSDPNIVNIVVCKKFFAKKGETYVGEQRVASSREPNLSSTDGETREVSGGRQEVYDGFPEDDQGPEDPAA